MVVKAVDQLAGLEDPPMCGLGYPLAKLFGFLGEPTNLIERGNL
jgi:hypothetical protein